MTRQDLTPGYQTCQPAHALAKFAVEYPQEFKKWYTEGQNLIVLAATNEKQLLKLVESLRLNDLKHVVFQEPDIGNKSTAVCIEPHELTYKLTSSLPLAMRDIAKPKGKSFLNRLGFG